MNIQKSNKKINKIKKIILKGKDIVLMKDLNKQKYNKSIKKNKKLLQVRS